MTVAVDDVGIKGDEEESLPSDVALMKQRKRARSSSSNCNRSAADASYSDEPSTDEQPPALAPSAEPNRTHGEEADGAAAVSVTTAFIASNATDKGHRFGNFHNYYSFHPVTNRTTLLGGMLDWIASEWCKLDATGNIFRYTDIGCNEGDLTLEVARLLADRFATSLNSESVQGETTAAVVTSSDDTPEVDTLTWSYPTVQVTGVDLDPLLIERAQRKVHEQLQSPMIRASFRAVDVLKEGILLDYESKGDSTTNSSLFTADLTTLFSTTMWIHIHGGDEGLRRVLFQICASTRAWILLEPQPSKCYGTAATRLRRLCLEPPVDVSSDRLQLRANVEEAVEAILAQNQFERVAVGVADKTNNAYDESMAKQGKHVATFATGERKTSWNRSLRLYRRVSPSC